MIEAGPAPETAPKTALPSDLSRQNAAGDTAHVQNQSEARRLPGDAPPSCMLRGRAVADSVLPSAELRHAHPVKYLQPKHSPRIIRPPTLSALKLLTFPPLETPTRA